MKLSLKEAVKLALERNLDLKAELYNPAQAEADLRKSRSIYEPRLKLDTVLSGSNKLSSIPPRQKITIRVRLSLLRELISCCRQAGLSVLYYQNIKESNST